MRLGLLEAPGFDLGARGEGYEGVAGWFLLVCWIGRERGGQGLREGHGEEAATCAGEGVGYVVACLGHIDWILCRRCLWWRNVGRKVVEILMIGNAEVVFGRGESTLHVIVQGLRMLPAWLVMGSCFFGIASFIV